MKYSLSKHLKRIQKDFKMCHKKVKMKKKHLPNLEKGKALAWLEERINQKDKAQRLRVSLSTIESLVPTRKVGSGSEIIASKSLIKLIENIITETPKMTCKEMKAKYKKIVRENNTKNTFE